MTTALNGILSPPPRLMCRSSLRDLPRSSSRLPVFSEDCEKGGEPVAQRSMMGLVREGKAKVQGHCFFVTWDIDSEDRRAVGRAQYFLFGRTYQGNGKPYSYRGFVWREGVRYMAQSAVLVTPDRLEEIVRFLASNGIDYEVESLLRP